MRRTDVAIVGGGLAGSIAAAMLGHSGVEAVLIDQHSTYPFDFRCEKLDESQVRLLRKTGLAEGILPLATRNDVVWVARSGKLIEKRPLEQFDILYPSLVNTARAQIPSSVEFLQSKVAAIATHADRQIVTLADGEQVSARLVVLANGLNTSLRQALGMSRVDLSVRHSISIGFDVSPVGRDAFQFPALTYGPEKTTDRMAYLTLFPVDRSMRANLFVYRPLKDPWFAELREAPKAAIASLMPGLRKLMGEFDVIGPLKVRPVDLYTTQGYRQPGVVLVGDAFATSCPAAGTGVNKVLTDVERLCNLHIPNWLASSGMGVEKIGAFYDDPVKKACDASSLARAFHLRSLSTEVGLPWRVRRWARFVGRSGAAALRRSRERLSVPAISAR